MIYAVTVYCYLGPQLGLVVRKHLALLGVESSEARWSSSPKSISEVKGYSDWKCNGYLPLVMLALSGPEEAFQWLLSQLLRYSFCGVCGNEMEGLALITRGQKSLFPHWPVLGTKRQSLGPESCLPKRDRICAHPAWPIM